MLDYLKVANETGNEIIPKNEATKERRGITPELMELIMERGRALKEGNWEEVRNTDNRIRKQKKHEKKEHHKHITRRDLDTRDRYLGIKQIKKRIPTKHIPLQAS